MQDQNARHAYSPRLYTSLTPARGASIQPPGRAGCKQQQARATNISGVTLVCRRERCAAHHIHDRWTTQGALHDFHGVVIGGTQLSITVRPHLTSCHAQGPAASSKQQRSSVLICLAAPLPHALCSPRCLSRASALGLPPGLTQVMWSVHSPPASAQHQRVALYRTPCALSSLLNLSKPPPLESWALMHNHAAHLLHHPSTSAWPSSWTLLHALCTPNPPCPL